MIVLTSKPLTVTYIVTEDVLRRRSLMDTGDEEKMKKLPGAPKRQVNNLDVLCHLGYELQRLLFL